MKPSEIRNFVFNKGAFGYKVEEVENCLNDIADFVELMQKEYNDAQKELQELRSRTSSLQEDEDSVKQIIISAQRLSSTVASEAKAKAKELVDSAQRERDQTLADATVKSKAIISEAEQKAREIERDIIGDSQRLAREAELKSKMEEERLAKLKSEVSGFKTSLLTIYKKHLQHLDMLTQLSESGGELQESVKENEDMTEISSTGNPFPIDEEKTQDSSQINEDDRKTVKTTPFKITITEKKPASDMQSEPSQSSADHQKQEDEKFHSRFGELEFGSHTDPEE